MKGHLEPVPGGQNLLDFVNFVASELHELRGFELATLAILLNLNRAPCGRLRLSLAELGRLSGTLEATALRLAKILATRNLVGIEAFDDYCLTLSLTPFGRSLLVDLVRAHNS